MKKRLVKKKRKIKKPKLRIPVAPPEIVFPDETKYDRKRIKDEDHRIIIEQRPQGPVAFFTGAPTGWVM